MFDKFVFFVYQGKEYKLNQEGKMYKPKTGKNAAKQNRSDIEEYLKNNPDTTGIEICKKLNLSKPTVYKHLAEIRKEYYSIQKNLA